jgi:hypothetical protein
VVVATDKLNGRVVGGFYTPSMFILIVVAVGKITDSREILSVLALKNVIPITWLAGGLTTYILTVGLVGMDMVSGHDIYNIEEG